MRFRSLMAAAAVTASTLGVFATTSPAQAAPSCGSPLYQADWVRFICTGSGKAYAEIRCAPVGSGGRHTEWFRGPTKTTPAHIYADCPDGWYSLREGRAMLG